MGTGKSAMAIESTRDARVVLIVCPIAVGPAWVKQYLMWDASRSVCLAVSGTQPERIAKIKDALDSGERVTVVINYDSVYRAKVGKVIAATAWGAIVCDESHKLKSPTGKASKFLAKLSESLPEARKICMTGTPTPNNPLDWWAQFRFLDRDILGADFRAFRNRIAVTHPMYSSWIISFRPDAMAAMRERIDSHVYRVTSDEVLDLPDLIHTDIPVELSGVVRRFYTRLEDDMVAEGEGGLTTVDNPMVLVGRLQQASSGYHRADDSDSVSLIDPDTKSDKIESLSEWLAGFGLREPLVIFAKFSEDIRLATIACTESGRTVSELSGRKKQLEQWQAGETDVIVVQQQCGSAGVDLTRSCYAIYVSLSHSLGDFEQSLARLRRPGQTRCVRFYHLVATDTIDEAIYSALVNKKSVVESVLSRLTRRVGV